MAWLGLALYCCHRCWTSAASSITPLPVRAPPEKVRESVGDSSAWVRAAVDLRQPGRVEVRVDLRGDEVGVAEQLLDGPEVGAALEQVGGVRVTQRVGRHAGARGMPGEDPPGVARRQVAAARVEEKG